MTSRGSRGQARLWWWIRIVPVASELLLPRPEPEEVPKGSRRPAAGPTRRLLPPHARSAQKISFSSRSEIGIQAADVWVRELMKRCDGHLFSDRYDPRPQWKMLQCSGRFGANVVLAEHFQDLKRQRSTVQEQTGVSPEKYGAWLTTKGIRDNQSNRIRYIIDTDAQEREAKLSAGITAQ